MKKRILILGMVLATLATLAVLAVPMTTMAATTNVTGTVASLPSTISVTAPSAINFGTFAVGANNSVSTTAGSVTITPGNDSPSGWTCTAVSSSGYMLNGSTQLHDELMVSKNGSTYASAATGLTYSGTGLTGSLPLQAKQTIMIADIATSYTINIVFTAYITP